MISTMINVMCSIESIIRELISKQVDREESRNKNIKHPPNKFKNRYALSINIMIELFQ